MSSGGEQDDLKLDRVQHVVTAEGLRELIRGSFGPAMKIGLQDAQLFDEPGAERIEEWITYITSWVTDAVVPELDRLQAELAHALGELSALRNRESEPATRRQAEAHNI